MKKFKYLFSYLFSLLFSLFMLYLGFWFATLEPLPWCWQTETRCVFTAVESVLLVMGLLVLKEEISVRVS